MRKQQKGFTLIELLVVIAIIGLLATLAVVALNNARAKSRDARRISDIKQIQTALELYYNDADGYTIAASMPTVLGYGSATYMAVVPENPSPGGATYTYTSSAGTSYTITFVLESGAGSFDAGTVTATPSGMSQ